MCVELTQSVKSLKSKNPGFPEKEFCLKSNRKISPEFPACQLILHILDLFSGTMHAKSQWNRIAKLLIDFGKKKKNPANLKFYCQDKYLSK